MAKPPVTTKQPTETKAVVQKQSQVPAVGDFFDEVLEDDAGLGTSQNAADNLIPLIYILQTNSPQVNKRDEQYVEGAEPGDIWLRGTQTVFKGDEGFEFQSCYFHTAWCEWNPKKRGQFAGHHIGGTDQIPPDHLHAEQVEYTDEKGNKKKRWTLPNGNIVVFTRYHVGNLVMQGSGNTREFYPFVIPFASTGHTVSKGWMTAINNKKRNGKIIPSFGYTYILTTRLRSNDDGSWFQFYVDDQGTQVHNMTEYEIGKALCKSFMSGEKKMEEPEDQAPFDSDPNGRM